MKDCQLFGLKIQLERMEKEKEKYRMMSIKQRLDEREMLRMDSTSEKKKIKLNLNKKECLDVSELYVEGVEIVKERRTTDNQLVMNYFNESRNGNNYIRPILSKNADWVEIRKELDVTEEYLKIKTTDVNYRKLLACIDSLIERSKMKDNVINFFEHEHENLNFENEELKEKIAKFERENEAKIKVSNGEDFLSNMTYESVALRTNQNMDSFLETLNK